MLKLILADNQAIFRAGIAKVLAVEDEMRIVAQAQTTEQMFMALDKFRAAVLVIAGGFHSDFNAVLSAANRNKTRVVVLADTGESAQRYMAAGAHGVVYRNVTSAALVDCVRKVARGETWVQDMAVPSELTENDMVGLRVRDRLTAKELRIVALIVQGYKNKEIATQLGTTEQVIKNYLRNVYDKIGVSDRLELALFTIHHRILNEAAAASRSQCRARAPAGRGRHQLDFSLNDERPPAGGLPDSVWGGHSCPPPLVLLLMLILTPGLLPAAPPRTPHHLHRCDVVILK